MTLILISTKINIYKGLYLLFYMNQTEMNKRWMKKQEIKGLCIFCKNKSLEHSKMCEKHYLISMAVSTLKNRRLADELLTLFNLQNGKCYLTGRKLIFGLNAGIDHIIPRSKNSNLISDIRNVRWIDKKVNEIKRDLTDKEFVKLCKDVLDNYTLELN